MPGIDSQEISLWSGKEHLGLIPVKEVINDYLSPGTILSLRGDPPSKKHRTAPQSYDYEVRRLNTRSTTRSNRHPRDLKAKEIWLNAFSTPDRLKHIMEAAYGILHPQSRASVKPVEFHIRAYPREGLTGLSTFTWGRVDLHPAVILRALPEGAFQVVKPKIDRQGSDALWVVAPKDFKIKSMKLPDDPEEAASVVEKMIIEKKERLKRQIFKSLLGT